MDLKIRITKDKNDYQMKEDIELLKNILKRNGITMRLQQHIGGEDTYTLRGRKEYIAKKISRGAGAKSKTTNIKIETIIQMEKECYRNPTERDKVLKQLGIGYRRYLQIKKAICAGYGSLDEAIRQGHIYFVSPDLEIIKNYGIKKKREKEALPFENLEIEHFK